MNIKIYRREDTDVTYKQIIDLLHSSFQERLAQGLRYSCSFMTEEQYIEKTKKGIVLVAIDEETKKLAGTTTLNLDTVSGVKRGYMEYVAIEDAYKHCGIGNLLVEEIKKLAVLEKCSYILSDTSTQAISAVRYHLKNGYKIVGLESFRSTNYWSYVFRMQMIPSKKWESDVYCKFRYFLSWLFMHITRDINGNDTTIGKIHKVIKRKCKN